MNFSLIIPTYKRENSLERALNSVIKNSVFPNEMIVINDNTLGAAFSESGSLVSLLKEKS